jgi:5-dehydro-4-deoxyglucarate dehydratase
MDPYELRNKLSGVIAFPVSPFQADYALDVEGLRRNIRFLLKHPVCALVAGGGSGEFYSLTPDEYRTVLETIISEAAGKVPVIATVGFNVEMASEMARYAEAQGAGGILVFPPYYFNAHDEGLFEYYTRVAAAAPRLGQIIYTRDWVVLSSGMVERLSKIPNMMALKDGQGDIRRLQTIKARLGDRLHWIGGAGDDMLPGYLALGIRTYTSSLASIAPRLALQLHDRGCALDNPSVARLMMNYVIPLYNIRARRRGYEVAVIKTCMQILGMPAGPVRPPLVPVRPEEENEPGERYGRPREATTGRWPPPLEQNLQPELDDPLVVLHHLRDLPELPR